MLGTLVGVLGVAAALGTVGCVLRLIPEGRSFSQSAVKAGATLAMGFFYVANVLFASPGSDIDGGAIGIILLIGFAGFGIPWIWKRFKSRRTERSPEPPATQS
jgi:hypothetical protein